MSSPVVRIHTHEQLGAVTPAHSCRASESMLERLTQPHLFERIAACGDCKPVAS